MTDKLLLVLGILLIVLGAVTLTIAMTDWTTLTAFFFGEPIGKSRGK